MEEIYETWQQPIRIPSGWEMRYNRFAKVDPDEDNIEDLADFDGYFMLILISLKYNWEINLMWLPPYNKNGFYTLVYFPIYFYKMEDEEMHHHPYEWFPVQYVRRKSRVKILKELERLLVELPVMNEPRIYKNSRPISSNDGGYQYEAECLRMELEIYGISQDLVQRILANGNKQLKSLIIDHPYTDRKALEVVVEKSTDKTLRNRALSKLKSRKFRQV
ncbi:MAG: hypothetical protein OEW75_18840 [Cyclobacteriaceae bacterium]|nr:hypothetical protein [Cyclobacteriaceae bacterium]